MEQIAMCLHLLKVCSHCGLSLPLCAFHKKTASKDGLQDHCKNCKSIHHSKSNPKRTSGKMHVYFIRCGDFVKIGYARGVKHRLNSLQVGNPYPMVEVWSEPGTEDDEKEYHRIFSHRHHRGEWFLMPE